MIGTRCRSLRLLAAAAGTAVIAAGGVIGAPGRPAQAEPDPSAPGRYLAQASVPGVEAMPRLPDGIGVIDWQARAEALDEFLYDLDWEETADRRFATIVDDETYGGWMMPAFYGDVRAASAATASQQEAITILGSLFNSTLAGIDKDVAYPAGEPGETYLDSAKKFFRPSGGVFTNFVASSGGIATQTPYSDFWYVMLANLNFYRLASQYPQWVERDEEVQGYLLSVAEQMKEMVDNLGGENFAFPGNVKGYNFDTDEVLTWSNAGTQPDGAAAAAMILIYAWRHFDDPDYLERATWAMDFLAGLPTSTNPYYEFAALEALSAGAILNAVAGTEYDLAKFMNWVIGTRGSYRNWGGFSARTFGLDVGGLTGTGGSAAYFFNSVYPLTTLVQLAKYDPSWAKAAGRWALNLTNSARYFLPDQRAAANQSNPEFLGGPEAAVLAYERLNTNDLKATGDAMVSPGWGTGPDVTDLAIYGMIYTGALGGLVQTTNVENLLRFDANKTDYFTAEAADGEAAKYPTWLYYNPHTTVQAVQIDLGASPRDLFDSTKGVYLAQNATGVQTFRMLGDSASVIAVLPAGSPAPVMDGQTVTIGGVLVSHSTADVLPLPGDDAVEQVAISGSAAITARGATATYSAEVTPSSAISLDVTWSVAGVDGRATAKAVIGPDDGVLTPVLNGQVVVRATARDGSGVFDEQVVTISGQTLPYLSLNKPVTVSHTINQAKERINDGDVSTRWNGRTGTSGDAHPWVYIDLVNPAQISLITVEWESAYARDFRVQWSNDASTWQDIEVFANQSLSNHAVSAVSQASLDALAQAAPDGVRYVRMYVDAINNASWGVSVYEFSIDGSYNITQPVTALTVAGAGGAEEITRPGRALQMVATALPLDATDTRVEWYVYDLSGNETAAADVDSTGRLIPLADGLVQVVARSVDGGDVSGACEISITGQSKPNLALGRPIGANRSEMPVSYANDGSYATRWSSGSMAADDRAAVEVDLGAARLVDSVAVAWEAAAAPSYLVQVRLDAAAEWTTVGSGAGVGDAIQDIDFAPVLARHVRLAEMTRSSYGGVSIWELEVYGPLLYLRFDLNGLSAWFEDLQTPADLAAEHGSVIGDLPELELFGQVFLGWNTAADGSGAWYQTGDVFTASQAVTLYAQYEPDLGAPEPLALRSQTGVKCIAGKAYLTVTAFNDSDQAAAITVTTPFGVKVFPSIAGGKSGFHSFTTRMAAYSGVPVAVSGQAVDDPTLTGSTEPTVAAASCG